jgi:hypothetical protein
MKREKEVVLTTEDSPAKTQGASVLSDQRRLGELWICKIWKIKLICVCSETKIVLFVLIRRKTLLCVMAT